VITTKRLANGIEMPLLGLGVWQLDDGRATEDPVGWALEAGYRHVDTAQAYGNEAGVGRAIAASGVPRDEIFVTTKFFPRSSDPVAEAERSLERLGIERLDLYIVHWPEGGPTWAWSGMQAALERGLTRAIGVSNFSVEELAAVCAAGDVAPVVNQVQFSPFTYRRALLAECERRGIALEAYSPLTRGEELADPVTAEIARAHDRTPAQVLLRWAVERSIPVIPKSANRERIVENSRIFDFALGAEELARLDGLDRTGGTERATERPWWTPGGRARGLAGRVAGAIRGRR
jgi:diketogulonate reductase-like aldo/keto reductase